MCDFFLFLKHSLCAVHAFFFFSFLFVVPTALLYIRCVFSSPRFGFMFFLPFFWGWVGNRGKAQSDASKFPVAAGLASTAHGTDNMLEKLPVGTMAGILKVGPANLASLCVVCASAGRAAARAVFFARRRRVGAMRHAPLRVVSIHGSRMGLPTLGLYKHTAMPPLSIGAE